eukprot:COSAG02_NODE_7580_length_2950_cov_17.981059_2_plen_182_part_00
MTSDQDLLQRMEDPGIPATAFTDTANPTVATGSCIMITSLPPDGPTSGFKSPLHSTTPTKSFHSPRDPGFFSARQASVCVSRRSSRGQISAGSLSLSFRLIVTDRCGWPRRSYRGRCPQAKRGGRNGLHSNFRSRRGPQPAPLSIQFRMPRRGQHLCAACPAESKLNGQHSFLPARHRSCS